jgi:hypothetical protein
MRRALAAAALLLAAGAAGASNCAAISAGIEAKIRAAGVADFTLQTVEAGAPTQGKVVGTCDRGTKKIAYRRGGGSAPTPAAAGPASAAARPAKGGSVITECMDGSMPVDGRCKSR